MTGEYKGKVTDTNKDETTRRTELAILYLLMEKYPQQAREKIKKPTSQPFTKRKTVSL